MAHTDRLIERIESKRAVVGVIGLGYVGLPLCAVFRRAGFRVLGFDIDSAKTEALNQGRSYIGHIPGERIREMLADGMFEATPDFARGAEADALLICVPTPLTARREPDLSHVEGTCRSIAPHLRPGQLVVLESTTYPGTTRGVVRPILEESGLRAGVDFLLAYSPEREDPGNPEFSTDKIPKVVGGLDPESLAAAEKLYSKVVVRTVAVSSADTAEAVKLTENIFRCVNIALVNELKMIYTRLGIDVWEVIEAAKTKPFGYMPFYPGPGLGGHCIPIDPFYLSWLARGAGYPAQFIELAGEINTAMPDHVINVVTDALNETSRSVRGSRILIIGMAYKKNVDDTRDSPSIVLMERLLARGATVDYHDPHVAEIPALRDHPDLKGRKSVPWNREALGAYDCVLIATDHDKVDYDELVEAAGLIVDTRNATARIADPDNKVRRA